MIRVLHVVGAAIYGGMSTVVLSYYKNIDHSRIHFDIVVTDRYIGRNAKTLEEMGCTIYPICLKSENISLYTSQLTKIIKEGNYNVIHVHGNDTSWVSLRIAKRLGVQTRIAHAHTAGHLGTNNLRFRIRQLICQYLNRHYSTHLLSCGKKAGEFIFGKTGVKSKKHMVLPNAIDVSTFSFCPDKRQEIRDALQLHDKFIVGMIGRVAPPKNTVYAISLFKAIKDKVANAKLLMIGDGPDIIQTKAEVEKLGLDEDVQFLGQRSDVYDLYQAMDLYLLPSLYEGFPVAAVEAMTTGLPCLLSDTITDELNFGKNVHYLPLGNPDAWGIVASQYIKPHHDRFQGQREVQDNNLDITKVSKKLEELYITNNV